MKGDDAAFPDHGTIHLKVAFDAFVAVVAVNKKVVEGLISESLFHAGQHLVTVRVAPQKVQALPAAGEALVEPLPPGAIATAEFSARQVNTHDSRVRAGEAGQEEKRAALRCADFQGAFGPQFSKNFTKCGKLTGDLYCPEVLVSKDKIDQFR